MLHIGNANRRSLTCAWFAAAGNLPSEGVRAWVADVTNFKKEEAIPSVPEACRPLCETPTFRAELSLTMPVFDVEGPLAMQRRHTAPASPSTGGSHGAADPAGTRAADKALGKRPVAETGGSSKETTSSAATTTAATGARPPQPVAPRSSGRHLVRGDGTPVSDRTSTPRKKAKTSKKKPAGSSPLSFRVNRVATR